MNDSSQSFIIKSDEFLPKGGATYDPHTAFIKFQIIQERPTFFKFNTILYVFIRVTVLRSQFRECVGKTVTARSRCYCAIVLRI